MVKKKDLNIRFLGAAGTVTGSKTLLSSENKHVLIDCGMFQGLKPLRELNWAKFPFPPHKINEIIITHAHLDHVGYLPVLVKHGFSGPIHCTFPTKDLTEIILMDSAKIQEEDAERANKFHYAKHRPAKPLYSCEDVKKVLPLLVPHELNEWVIVNNFIKFRYRNAGHILGSATVDVQFDHRRLVFSGDLGRKKSLLLDPPTYYHHADYVVVESTYGNRKHPKTNPFLFFKREINETIRRKGIVLIPSFALERTQEILHILALLRENKEIPHVPVYLDSPMGIDVTDVFKKYPEWHHLSNNDIARIHNNVKMIEKPSDSEKIINDDEPKIVIAGSGMIEGGRILAYLKKYITDSKSKLILVGFQAEGTRGRALLEHAREIKFYGEYYPVKIKVRHINSMSAHADYTEIMNWLKHLKKPPKTVFINHGELPAAHALRVRIETKLGWNTQVPLMNSSFLVD
ncbi:MAG: MBL fold metallo-hydrolase [Candidatus Hydrogenedentota bacterium]|nr:MAG: MBL fold metallo-hydrolase [Candidatus Hydrogenedentota bacterium]